MPASGGDILVVQKEGERPFWLDVYLDGSTTSYTAKTSRGNNHAFFVQKITLSITTHATGKSVAVQDSNSVVIFNHQDTAAAVGIQDVFPLDAGPHGIKLTEGKDLVVTQTGTGGVVGVVHIEGYEKLTQTINENLTANNKN
jgi:hypothetical protein